MRATRSNYGEALAKLRDLLSTQDVQFVSMDTEFTGLSQAAQEMRPNATDTAEIRYMKTRLLCSQFLVLELGVCVVYRNKDTGASVTVPFNFTCFPADRGASFNGGDRRFSCQASCLRFLATQGFDFNKAFQDGIPFLTKDEEKECAKEFERRLNKNQNRDVLDLGEAAAFVNQQLEAIKTWKEGAEESLDLPTCDAFRRRLLYQEVERVYGKTLAICSKTVAAVADADGTIPPTTGPPEKFISVSRAVPGAEEQHIKEQQLREQKLREELDAAVGLRRVIEAVAESRAPLVVHNGLLDLCYIYAQFYNGLPKRLGDFKTQLHALFPQIYDTKLLAEHNSVMSATGSSVVGKLYKAVLKTPFVLPDLEKEDSFLYGGDAKEHEAGYDAYITAIVFLGMPSVLQQALDKENNGASLDRAFANKLYVTRSDIPFIDLEKDEETVDRSNMVHCAFPVEWQTSDLRKAFAFAGQVQIRWINDMSAIVSVANSDTLSDAVYDTQLHVQPFSDFAKQQQRFFQGNSDEDEAETAESKSFKRRRTLEF